MNNSHRCVRCAAPYGEHIRKRDGVIQCPHGRLTRFEPEPPRPPRRLRRQWFVNGQRIADALDETRRRVAAMRRR